MKKPARKAPKKAKTPTKVSIAPPSKRPSVARRPAAVAPTLQRIAQQQEEILRREERIEAQEHSIKSLEEKDLAIDKASLHADQKEHPLARVTGKDVMKAIVGSFIGTIVYAAFLDRGLASAISVGKATTLLVATFIIGLIFLYGTGFRRVQDKRVAWMLPYRLIVLYATSIIVVFVTLWFFAPGFLQDPSAAYRELATVNVVALLGACTADLIGRN
jgi:uncharacterized membrane protein